jgi:hypothetical protein
MRIIAGKEPNCLLEWKGTSSVYASACLNSSTKFWPSAEMNTFVCNRHVGVCGMDVGARDALARVPPDDGLFRRLAFQGAKEGQKPLLSLKSQME